MNLIEQLKNNEKPFGLMSKEMQRVAKEIGKANFEFYNTNGEWVLSSVTVEFADDIAYRLKPDYQEELEIIEVEIVDDGSFLRLGETAPAKTRIRGKKVKFLGYRHKGKKRLLKDFFVYLDKDGCIYSHQEKCTKPSTATHAEYEVVEESEFEL